MVELYPPQIEVDVCQEDEPCWDCTTMGNLRCGPIEATTVDTPPATELPATGFGMGDQAVLGAAVVLVGVIFTRIAHNMKGRREC